MIETMRNPKYAYYCLFAAAVALALLGCSRGKPKPFESLSPLQTPAAAGAAQSKLYTPDGEHLYMTWIEPLADSTYTLRYSRLFEGAWSTPVTMARGENWFLHFAELPSMVTLSSGAIVGQWIQLNPREPTAHDIQVVVSRDGGDTWSRPVKPHKWHRPAEYGMVSMVPFAPDRALVMWLDGRDHPRQTQLRGATVTDRGRVHNNRQIDATVCDCCPTDAALIPDGMIVAYRDRSPQNFRDISVVRMTNGLWQEPQNVYPDRWRETTCPVSGPAIDAVGENVAVAWYTRPRGAGIVKVAFSKTAGKHFSRPIVVSDDRPRGNVDVALMVDGSAVVCWVEAVSGRGQEIRAQRVWPDGEMSKNYEVVAPPAKGFAGCVPRVVRIGEELIFSWTQPSNPTAIKTAVARVKN